MFNTLKTKVKIDSNGRSIKDDSSSLHKAPSNESLNSIATSEVRSKRKDEFIKKWESKVQNLVNTVREKNILISELENQLAGERKDYEKKLAEMKESSALNVKSLLDDHMIHVQKMEQEKEKLKKRAVNAENQAELLRKQSFKVDEEENDIKDLSIQELAKVKHLLLLKEKDNELLTNQIEEYKTNVQNLEATIKNLKSESLKRQNDLSKIVKEKELESEERRSQQTTIRGLLNDKENLEQKLEECKNNLERKETLLNRIERSSADLHTKLQQVSHECDQWKTKFNRLEEEKADRESDLKDRVRSLEYHLALVRDTEEGDEKLKLLEDKCFQLEARNREEKELKDKLLKSWIERVDSLESQIYNLNKKIAEDGEEISSYNETKAKIREDYEKQIKELKQEIIEKDKRISNMLEEMDELSSKMTKEKTEKDQLNDKMYTEYQNKCTENSDLSKEIFEMKKENMKLQEQMNSTLTELKSKTSLSMKLDEEVKRLKVDVEEKSEEVTALNSERFKRELRVTDLNSQVSNLESVKTELENRIFQIDTEYKSLQKQIKHSIEEKEAAKKNLETSKEQVKELKSECDHRIVTMQIEVESKVRELDVSHAEIKELNEQLRLMELEKETVIVGVESNEILKLKSQLEALNTQLSDKNNIIRTQKQKINDLKKTLSKEIKLNNNLNSNMTESGDLLSSRNNSSNQLSFQYNSNELYQSDSGLAKYSSNPIASIDNISCSSSDELPVVVDRNGFVILDQINFKYLKHVILKFLLSKDSEAYHMVKAVSTLLRLTNEEEKEIKSMLNARSSWFTVSKSKSHKGVQDRLKRKKVGLSDSKSTT